MTYKLTTPEEEARIKKYFTERITSLKLTKTFYRDRLFKGLDYFNPETWDKIMADRPENAVTFLTFLNLIDAYEMLSILTDSAIQAERNIKTLDDNFRLIIDKNRTDISAVAKNIAELEKTLVPSVQRILVFVDGANKEDQRKKKNGEAMIV